MLRPIRETDVAMAVALSTDPYLPLIGTLPAQATPAEAAAWVQRQHDRWTEGRGFSFAIADATDDRALGQIGLWLERLPAGRASAGYAVVPAERGRGVAADALTALTAFAWTIPALHRVELFIEPWNSGSIHTAERAGYQREGLLRSYQEIGGVRRDMLLYATVRPSPDDRVR